MTVPKPPADNAERAGQAYLFVLSSSFAFALMGALSHLAGERTDWQIVAVARTLVAFVLSAALALSTGVRIVLFRPSVLWVRSIAGSVGVLCAFYALTHLPISTALALSNTVPVWVTLLAWPVLGHRPAGSTWMAIAVGIVGMVLVRRPEASGDWLAALLALGNAFCTAIAMIGLNRLRGVDARAVVVHFSGVSAVFTLLFLLASGGAASYATMRESAMLLVLCGVGLAGTLGQLAMTRAFALGDPSRVSVVGLMQVVFALLLDLFIWRRQFDSLTLLGIALVMLPSGWLILNAPLKRSTPIHVTS